MFPALADQLGAALLCIHRDEPRELEFRVHRSALPGQLGALLCDVGRIGRGPFLGRGAQARQAGVQVCQFFGAAGRQLLGGFADGVDVVEELAPVIVFVQGSAWFEQQHGHSLLPMATMAERGFAVVMVEYRPSSVAPFPAQIRDLNTAIAFIRANAAEWGCDADRLVLWGDSSGGHTVSLAGLTQGDQDFYDETLDGDASLDLTAHRARGIACVVDYFGPVDIRRMNEEPSTMDHGRADSPEGMLIGGRDLADSPELAEATVVTRYVDPESATPPFFIAHGTKDRLVPFGQSVLLWQALKEAGHPAEFYRLEGADHAGDPFWAPTFLDVVESFIREHVAG